MVDLSIGELALRAGVSPSAIRYYEQAGLLPAPPRRSGRRCFDEHSVRRIRFIVLAREAGAGIRDLAEWRRAWDAAGEGGAPLREPIQSLLDRVDRRTESLRRVRLMLAEALGCPCTSPTDCGLIR